VVAVRVLHVLDVSMPMIAGYTARAHSIVSAQRALGLDPVVLTSVRQDNPDGRACEEIEGVRHYRTLRPAGKRQAALEIHYLRRRILEVAKRERPDVIHAHSSILCGIPGYLAARQLGLPCVYEIRAFWEDAMVTAGTTREGSLKYRAVAAAESALAKRVDALVCICNGLRDQMQRRGVGADRVHVVPNGVDTDHLTPMEPDGEARVRHGLAGKKVVAYIGTFFPFEGVASLVRTLAGLIGSGGRDDVRGLLVGEGATSAECRRLAAAAGMGDKILHLGRVPHREVKALYSIADVLVYPRLRHRLTELVTPLKPLEAMAMGKAVIGSDVGGLLELIEDGVTGLVHRAGDTAHLEGTIRRVIDDEPLRGRLGRSGREWVVARRQWRMLVERYFEVYGRACAARVSARPAAVPPPWPRPLPRRES
jgi:PEP-CTERM/exosortase A-associated glycosyltransferase